MDNPLRDREYAQIVNDLTRRHEGTFTRDEIVAVVDDSRARLEAKSKIHTYLPVFVGRFARERLGSLARERGGSEKGATYLLFVSEGNAGRSQMAAAFVTELGEGRYVASSAGVDPGHAVLPEVEAAMRERGVRLSDAFPKPVVEDVRLAADMVVGLGVAVEDLPRARQVIAWEVPPVAGLGPDDVRAARDDIEARVEALLRDLDDDGSATTRRRLRAEREVRPAPARVSVRGPHVGRHRAP